jgi:hypothetical protein
MVHAIATMHIVNMRATVTASKACGCGAGLTLCACCLGWASVTDIVYTVALNAVVLKKIHINQLLK